jgi:DnaJ-class molecular chaperone
MSAGDSFGTDYYKVLQIKWGASDAEIKDAFRRLALQLHPEKNTKDTKEMAWSLFSRLTEAYTVLSDAKLRAVFDQHGEESLKKGVRNSSGDREGGWSFNKDPYDIFSGFFGTANPFSNYFGDASEKKNPVFDDGRNKAVRREEPFAVNLYCSLEELYSGCTKRQRITRKRLSADGKKTVSDEVVKTVQIAAGWKEGTKITFKQEGNQTPGMGAGDLVLVLKQLPHPAYKRKGHSLLYAAKITLAQALTGCVVDVKTLDGRFLPVTVHQVVKPGLKLKLQGEGMPKPKNPKKRGDLEIDFDVEFPTSLTEKQKDTLREVLP